MVAADTKHPDIFEACDAFSKSSKLQNSLLTRLRLGLNGRPKIPGLVASPANAYNYGTENHICSNIINTSFVIS